MGYFNGMSTYNFVTNTSFFQWSNGDITNNSLSPTIAIYGGLWDAIKCYYHGGLYFGMLVTENQVDDWFDVFFFNGIYLDFYGDITNNSRIDIDVNGYDNDWAMKHG